MNMMGRKTTTPELSRTDKTDEEHAYGTIWEKYLECIRKFPQIMSKKIYEFHLIFTGGVSNYFGPNFFSGPESLPLIS